MGEAWATDSPISANANYTLITEVEDDDEDVTPIVYATTVNQTTADHWLPNSYTEAMTRPDLWQEPIAKELAVMHEREDRKSVV